MNRAVPGGSVTEPHPLQARVGSAWTPCPGAPTEPSGRWPAGRFVSVVFSAMSERPPPSDPDRRLTILATEHWSLLATRSLIYSESFSRVSTFLSVLSASMVAVALLAQVDQFGTTSRLVAVLLLLVVLLLGLSTVIRLAELNVDDTITVSGMNRLRGAYFELDPDAQEHFVTSADPGRAGVMETMGLSHLPSRGSFTHALAVLPVALSILLAVVVAVIVALVAGLLGAGTIVTLATAVVTFALAVVCLGVYNRRRFRSSAEELGRRS